MIRVPEIYGLHDLAPQYRNSCVGLFKCARGGWVELITGAIPTQVNTPEYTPSPMGGFEMVCGASEENVYFNSSELPNVPTQGPFTVFIFCRDATGSDNFGVLLSHTDFDGNTGWAFNAETYLNSGDVGATKLGVVDLPLSNLETANIDTFFAGKFNSSDQLTGFTDEGSQSDSNSTAIGTTGLDRITIGGTYRSSGFLSGSGANTSIGPYILVFNKELTDKQIETIARDPEQLVNNTLATGSGNPWFLHAFSPPAAGGGFSISCNLESLTLTEFQSNTDLDFSIASALESLTLTENTASVSFGYNVACSLETLTLTEFQSDTDLDFTISGTLESLTLTENNANVSLGVTVSCNQESLTLTEFQSDTDLDFAIAANLETLTLTEFRSNTDLDFPVNCSLESLELTDNNATVDFVAGDFNISATLESLALTDFNSSITYTGSIWIVQANDSSTWTAQTNDSSSWTIQ